MELLALCDEVWVFGEATEGKAAEYVFAALSGALGAVMGGFDGFLYALVVFVVVDYITTATRR